MARYIDADAFLNEMKYVFNDTSADVNLLVIKHKLETMDGADVAEVKHSEWKLYDDGSGVCKNCNTHQRDVWDMDNVQRFCCRCSAKMDICKIE